MLLSRLELIGVCHLCAGYQTEAAAAFVVLCNWPSRAFCSSTRL